MYRLDKMEIHGFKSFYDRTLIRLPEATTAVVGPNGCGKSNISDAIHWVLGEQRVRTLRGEKMEDVIFNGSERRKPLGMAEVTLHLSRSGEPPVDPAADGWLPDPDPADAELSASGSGDEDASGPAPGAVPQEEIVPPAPQAADAEASAGPGTGFGPDATGEELGAIAAAPEGNGADPAEESGRDAPPWLAGTWPETIRVTRRLFRDGQSEYLIDGARCRLRDLRDVLQRISVGSGASCIIEQGQVGQIVASKPRERRVLIEEAAGIAGFKARKREATLKLEATEANLIRLEDIIGEVRRQINSIKRQAGKARRYKRLMEERRRLERIAYHHRGQALDARLHEGRRLRAGAQDEETVAAARLAEANAEVEKLRAEVEEADRRMAAARDALHALDLQIDREERGIQAARKQSAELLASSSAAEAEAAALDERDREAARRRSEREAAARDLGLELRRLATFAEAGERTLVELRARIGEGEQRLEARRVDLFDLTDRAADRRNRLERLQQDCRRAAAAAERADQEATASGAERDELALAAGRLDAEIQEEERRVDMLDRAIHEWERLAGERREARQAEEERAERARLERGSLNERLESLQELDQEGSAQGRATRAAGESGRGIVADFVRPPREMEEAAESFLANLLPAVLLDDAAAAQGAVGRLEAAAGGRASFLVPPAQTVPAPPLPEALAADARVRGRLADLLAAQGRAADAVRAAADGALVVDDLASALDLAADWPERAFLTLRGEVVRPGGLITAGRSSDPANSILGLRRRIEETRARLLRAEQETSEATAAAAALAAALEEDAARCAEAGRERAARRVSLAELRERRKGLGEHRQRADRAWQIRLEEAARERADLATWTEEARGSEQELAGVERERAGAEEDVRTSAEEIERLRSAHEEAAQDQAEMRSRHEVARERLEAASAELRSLAEASAELLARASRLREDAVSRRTRAATLEELVARTEISLRGNVEQRAQEKRRLDDEAGTLAVVRDRANARGEETKQLAAALEEIRGRRMEHELAVSRAESEREFLEQSCRNDLDQSLAEAGAALGEGEAELPLDEVNAALGEVRERIERLGPVNVMAVEEYAELEERYRFLTVQQTDLRDSVRSLKETISRINRRSRERFVHTFEQVRSHFQEMFRLLFGGGRADLHLEESLDDVLEAGVEITAQPPGKRLQRIALLSGGEKALTAIALLFAIFRFRPSPFCVLDEVDAPLDEANVGRYSDMLRSMAGDTQFVVITHNKRTMQRADALYGVTMEEPGVSRLVSVRFHEDGRLATEDGARELRLDPPASKRATSAAASA